MTPAKLLEQVYLQCPNSEERRRMLLQHMKELDQKNFNCNSCPGYCCTFEFNSMQIDPLQALELYWFLIQSPESDQAFWDSIQQSIKDNRLDYEVSAGPGRVLRRYYTCPLFKSQQKLGCPIAFASKPYGCLAYNAREARVKLPERCGSDLSVLELREEKFSRYEAAANDLIRQQLSLDWDKRPLPVALFAVHQKFLS